MTIGEAGEVVIDDTTKMLFLNLGQYARAVEFLSRRLSQGMDDAAIKTFNVPKSFVDDLDARAVIERAAKFFPGAPLRVDRRSAPLQFGLRSEDIERLQRIIIQGSGRVLK